jgi:hypothetical protein
MRTPPEFCWGVLPDGGSLDSGVSFPQNYKKDNLSDQSREAVKDHIMEGAGPRWQETLMKFIEDRH